MTTGRGHVNISQLEKLKKFMKKHPRGCRGQDIADYIGVSHARAVRLVDLLSDYSEHNPDFLIYEEGSKRDTRYFVFNAN